MNFTKMHVMIHEHQKSHMFINVINLLVLKMRRIFCELDTGLLFGLKLDCKWSL
jgi:hypothetical protein